MTIEIGSKWIHIRTNNEYEVVIPTYNDVYLNGYEDEPTPVATVWYKNQQGEIYVRTEKHFLNSFKPYEPIFEYRYALDFEHLGISDGYYLDDSDFKAKNQLTGKFQRLDFTKRERK